MEKVKKPKKSSVAKKSNIVETTNIVQSANTAYAPDMAGTYIIVVDDNLNIVSVTRNGQLMKEQSPQADLGDLPQNFERVPNPNIPSNKRDAIVPTKLKHGCVGFGKIYDDPDDALCRWLWGRWW